MKCLPVGICLLKDEREYSYSSLAKYTLEGDKNKRGNTTLVDREIQLLGEGKLLCRTG